MVDPTFAAAIGELGVSIGIPDLHPEEDGSCLLGFDGILVTLEQDPEASRVVLTSHVAELPTAGAAAAYAELLEANMASLVAGRGASFAIDPAERRVLLAQTLPLQGLTSEALVGALGPFVDLVETWRARLESLPAASADGVDDASRNLSPHPGMIVWG
jgi:hypothetical protein